MAARSQKLIVIGALIGVAVGQGFSPAIAAGQGSSPATAPKRIISLVPAVTEILFAIGAGPQVIAVSSFDEDPPEVQKLPRVGALLDPDTERILSMRPDLVLIYGTQTELEKQLAAGGIRAAPFKHGNLADVTRSIRSIGDLTGHAAEAARVADDIERQLAAVRARVAGLPRPKTLLVIGREPQSMRHLNASGGYGFLHDLVELAGGTNVFGDIKLAAVKASTEMLIVRAPEVVIELHYVRELTPAELETERKAWQLLPSIPAVKAHHVHLLVGDHLVVPGPRIARAAEEFARAIHPDAYK